METPLLIERYAQVQGISVEEAHEQVGADTPDEILQKIHDKTLDKIYEQYKGLNRAQRRALRKKIGAKQYDEVMARKDSEASIITDAATKLNYIDLIQKLRKLNEEIEEKNDNTNQDN